MAEAPFRTASILYMEPDDPWCNYILRNFQAEKLHLKIETVNLSRLDMERPPEIEVALKESYVVILLTTCYLMDYMEQNTVWFADMLRQRNPEFTSIVCALVHVEEEDFQVTTTSGDYDQSNWKALEIDVMGKNMKACISQLLGLVDENAARRTAAKKVERTLPKTPSDSSFGKTGAVEMIPSTVQEEGEKMALIFPTEISGKVTVYVRGLKKEIPTETQNPYCFVFPAPAITGETRIKVNIDGNKYSELILCKKLVTVEYSSVDFMIQSYGATSREDLDKKLAKKFSASLCTDGRALEIFDDILGDSSTESIKQDSLYPSMLHWAAAYGMNDLCSVFLSAPGAYLAYNLENCDGNTPADLARKNKFFDLAEFLYEFTETMQAAKACEIYVKNCNVQQASVSNHVDDELYETMTPTAPPLPKVPPLPPREKLQSVTSPTTDDTYLLPVPGMSKPLLSPQEFLNKKIEPVLPSGAIGSRSQTELIDIMKEVKYGSFSMKEAEMLFSAWKARYETGNAASFKDRQRSLQALRDQHNRAVDTFKKLEKQQKKAKKTRGKSSTGEEEEDTVVDLISEPFQQRRPWGSLKVPPTGTGRGSNISDVSVSSWRSSHDSGRDSAVSQHSSSSDDLEHDDELMVRLRRDTRFQSDSSLEMKIEERKSKQEMFQQLTEDPHNLPDSAPPPLPPRHKPSVKTRIFSKAPTLGKKKDDRSVFKVPKI